MDKKNFQNKIIQSNSENTNIIQNNLEISLIQNWETQVGEYRNKLNIKTLFLLGIFGVSLQFYNIDMHGLLKKTLFQDMEIDEYQYQLLISLGGFLGVPLSLLGGLLLDKIGYSKGFIIYTTLVLIGSWVSVFGAFYISYNILLIGRTLFNVGLQLSISVQGALLSKWYKDGYLAQKNSFSQFMLKIGFISGTLIYPRLNEYSHQLFIPIFYGALICTAFYILGLLAPFIDYTVDKKFKKIKQEELDNNVQQIGSLCQNHQNLSFFEKIKIFKISFWLLIISFALNFSIIQIWTFDIQSLISQKFQLGQVNNGDLLSIGSAIGLSSPLVGYLLKKFNKNEIFMIFAQILAVFQYLYIVSYPQCEKECFLNILPAIVAYGIYLTLFPIISITEIATQSPYPAMTGTAYGLAYALKNLFQALIPIISVTPLLENDYIKQSNILLLGLTLILLILSIIIYIIKKKQQQNNQEIDKKSISKSINLNEENLNSSYQQF